MKLKKIMSIFLSALLILSFFGSAVPGPAYAASDVKYGQARRGEKSNKNNKAGDQTRKEVMISKWTYSPFSFGAEHWQYVYRCKDPDKARLIASTMVDICNNDHIGYDQNDKDRGTLYDLAKKNNWDITAIKKNCETTCSCAVSVCLNAAGISAPRLWLTRYMPADIDATGQFYCFTSKKYTSSSDKLTVGDILITPGEHTAVVVESPHPYTFPVTYTNPEGKKCKTQIAEDSDVILNLNNGEKTMMVKIDGEKNLNKIVPEKKDFVFTGWRKTSKSSFSAEYKGNMAPIRTGSPVLSMDN